MDETTAEQASIQKVVMRVEVKCKIVSSNRQGWRSRVWNGVVDVQTQVCGLFGSEWASGGV